MLPVLVLTFSLLLSLPAARCRVTTVGELAVLEGRSVTASCHYDPNYAGYVKYWCQGRVRDFCTSLARTDATHPAGDKVSIEDDPVQQVFTVTMKDLKEEESGWYWCGVEVGGIWTADVSASVYVNVIHGMSVVNSRVSGEEGSSVTVECLYSERYRDSEKRWCRSGDWGSCLAAASNGRRKDGSVVISDDKALGFTVTLKDLQMRDDGWYWCAAGQQRVAVHVQVTPRPSTTAAPPTTRSTSAEPLPTPRHSAKTSWEAHRFMLGVVVVCASLVLLLVLTAIARRKWNQHKNERRLKQALDLEARLRELPGDAADLRSGAVVFLNRDPREACAL